MAQSEMTLHLVLTDLPCIQRLVNASVQVVQALEGTAPLVVAELREALLALTKVESPMEDPH